MKKLIDAGYGYTVRTCVVSMRRKYILSFWGFACPLWWISPSYGIETILVGGALGDSTKRGVFCQEGTLEALEERLLERAKEEFPNPYLLPIGKDVRKIYPELYK